MTSRAMVGGIVLVTLCAATTYGILMRPDRDERLYFELAERFPASGIIGLPDGEGTLIAPQWVLTAAHIGVEVDKTNPRATPEFGGIKYDVEKIVIHPHWKKGGPHDIALLKLSKPVENITPIPIYRETDEVGQVITLVGHGYAGTLDKGPVKREQWDKKKRAGTNRFDFSTSHRLAFVVDRGDQATDLEATSGPGDSGCGAFLEKDGKIFVAAVLVATDDTNANDIVGDYDDREIGARVSAYAEWIDSIVGGAP